GQQVDEVLALEVPHHAFLDLEELGVPAGGAVEGGGLQFRRHVLHADDGAVGQRGGVLHGVLEFADVAGPGVAPQHVLGLRVEAHGGQVVVGGEGPQEVVRQQDDVLGALAQRGQAQGDDV